MSQVKHKPLTVIMVFITAGLQQQFGGLYRGTQKNLQNLLLTLFRQFRQLVGRYCS